MTEPVPFSPTVAVLSVGRIWDQALVDGLKPLGLTLRGYGLLGHIRRTPGISFSELGRRARITPQSAYTAVARLVASGLVHDGTGHAGSASTLTVTAAGEELLHAAAQVVARLDGDFADAHPELAAALRTTVDRQLREGDTFS